jgi:hypothetical protein
MRGVCALYNNKALALVTRSGSHALMSLMLPEVYEEKVPPGVDGDRWHPIMSLKAQGLVNGLPEVAQICVMIRNPAERFASSMARRKLTFEQAIAVKDEDVHFWSVESMGLINEKCSYFLFPEQINECAATLGLKTPVPRLNEESEKPVLDDKQLRVLETHYAQDLELFHKLKEHYHARV